MVMLDICPDPNFIYAAVASKRVFSIRRQLRSFSESRVVFSILNDRRYLRANVAPVSVSSQPSRSEPTRCPHLRASHNRFLTVSILIWSGYFVHVNRPGAISFAFTVIGRAHV